MLHRRYVTCPCNKYFKRAMLISVNCPFRALWAPTGDHLRAPTYVDITWKTRTKAESDNAGAEKSNASLHIFSFCICGKKQSQIPSMGIAQRFRLNSAWMI